MATTLVATISIHLKDKKDQKNKTLFVRNLLVLAKSNNLFYGYPVKKLAINFEMVENSWDSDPVKSSKYILVTGDFLYYS